MSRIPRMFSDNDSAQVLSDAKKISDLKNLGPSSEVDFQKAGIKTAQQFVKLGWKKSMHKLVQLNPKHCHSILAYAMIGALKNKEWFRLTEDEKKEAREYTSLLRSKLKQKKSVKK